MRPRKGQPALAKRGARLGAARGKETWVTVAMGLLDHFLESLLDKTNDDS
jgi:hypothetical protein